MTEEFTASNGLTLGVDNLNGKVRWRHGDDSEWRYVGEMTNGLGHKSNVWNAIEEWVRAKEDERLGRWRDPERSHLTAYPTAGYETDEITILDEQDAECYTITREAAEKGRGGWWLPTARAYFDAHPEPKPWHDAAEGEVWILMFPNTPHAWFVNGDYFQSTKTLTNIAKTDPGITAGRRIYPEPTE